MKNKARIIEILPDNKYIAVDENNVSYTAILKGNMKKNKIYVGDNVIIEENTNTFLISELLERKNSFVRPPVANIDYMVLCVSLDKPAPDYMLLDKQIILCKKKNIIPIICITKMDLINEKNKTEIEYIKKVYEKLDITAIYTSSYNDENIESKFNFEKGKIYSFSGNSGVGKSSMISKLLNTTKIEIGDVAEKTSKGKHTTKYVKLYELLSGAYIVDTPGFSSYDLIDVEYKELKNYYNEFNLNECTYLDCNHVHEGIDECDVKRKVENNIIDLGRYERYVYLFNDLKQKDNFKYKR